MGLAGMAAGSARQLLALQFQGGSMGGGVVMAGFLC
jgi:hypothetical protein